MPSQHYKSTNLWASFVVVSTLRGGMAPLGPLGPLLYFWRPLKSLSPENPLPSLLGILSFYNNTRHLAAMVLSFFIGFSFSKSYTHNNLNPLLKQHIYSIRETLKKNSKMNGGRCQKIFNVWIKWHFIRGGVWAKLMSFFQVIICQFFISSSCILRLIFNIIVCL